MSFNISVDNLFPEGKHKSGNNKKLDIDTLFKGTPLNDEPEINFSSDKLLDKINSRGYSVSYELKIYKVSQ